MKLSIAFVVAVAAPAAGAQVALPTDFITPPSQPNGDYFGGDLDLDGGVLAVGARNDSALVPSAGSASVFERSPGGGWVFAARLDPPSPSNLGFFGSVVAVSGDQVLVASHRDDTVGLDEGAVFVFERQTDGTWPLVQTLLPPDSALTTEFGRAMDATGDRLVIAAQTANYQVSPNLTYLYARQGDGTWAQEHTIVEGRNDVLGVEFSGDGGLLAASWADIDFLSSTETVFVYKREPGGNWTHFSDMTIAAFSPTNDDFGRGLAFLPEAGEQRLFIGAPGYGKGTVFVYRIEPNGQMTQLDTFTGLGSNRFGYEIVATPDRVYVGDPAPELQQVAKGQVYIVERTGPTNWAEALQLAYTPVDPGDGAGFGRSLALDGSELLVGRAGVGPVQATAPGAVARFADVRLLHREIEISVSDGGTQELFLAHGADLGGRPYLVLGTLSGTAPGLPLPGAIHLPLNPDAYTDLTLAGAGPLTGAIGILKLNGRADVTLTLPPASDPALVGLVAHHASVVLGLNQTLAAVGGPAPLTLVP
ncbi:FG-GAP repeat protein [Engelhardtia mirabilis]|uniref:FG-GAP repeat protein n=1 Tax=Engelhardtia mirabilis TaxID=2528011 RepID=A0A518BRB5_9BACT|nr:hypothetical protein Pla133_46420 [Planctomycetes bacterium Pla133]QDV03848.1 hypothetical protein Pla86_46400 [Planctomycetes bacterium Pla86]